MDVFKLMKKRYYWREFYLENSFIVSVLSDTDHWQAGFC